jgi:hypothetical protein
LSQGATSTGGGGGKVFLQTPECLIRFRGTLELEVLEERKAHYELGDEPPESRHALGEMLSLLQMGRRLHAINCFHLLWVHFDAVTRHEEAKELPTGTPNTHFLRLSLSLVVRRLSKASNRSCRRVSCFRVFPTMSST